MQIRVEMTYALYLSGVKELGSCGGSGKILCMLKTRFEWTILLLLAALLGGGWLVISREPVAELSFEVLTEAPLVGHLAPDFVLETTTTPPTTYTLNQYNGQPVVLNFWATWCGPCRIEMPHLQEASEEYNGRVAFLGVNQGESAEQITSFTDEVGTSYPILLDQDYVVNNRYQIRSLPTTLFINADGTVAEVIIGTINKAIIEDRVEQLLQNAEP
jgi:thiol-disulfide isomerase/thioredoxin